MRKATPSEHFPGLRAPRARAVPKARLEKTRAPDTQPSPEERYAAASSALGITPQEAFSRIATTLGLGAMNKDAKQLLLEREGLRQEWKRLRNERDRLLVEGHRLTVARAEFYLAKTQRPWYKRLLGA